MYVLEHRVCRHNGQISKPHWVQYVFCGRRDVLERVCAGLGDTKQWRISETAAAGKAVGRAA